MHTERWMLLETGWQRTCQGYIVSCFGQSVGQNLSKCKQWARNSDSHLTLPTVSAFQFSLTYIFSFSAGQKMSVLLTLDSRWSVGETLAWLALLSLLWLSLLWTDKLSQLPAASRLLCRLQLSFLISSSSSWVAAHSTRSHFHVHISGFVSRHNLVPAYFRCQTYRLAFVPSWKLSET